MGLGNNKIRYSSIPVFRSSGSTWAGTAALAAAWFVAGLLAGQLEIGHTKGATKCNRQLPIENRQVSLCLAEKVRYEQPAPRGRGGGSTPYPAPASLSLTDTAPGPGKGEVSPRFARSLMRPPATRTTIEAAGVRPSGRVTGVGRVAADDSRMRATGTVDAAMTTRSIATPVATVGNAVSGQDLDYFWLRESSCGKDPEWKIRGAAGEEGQYRITPPFTTEVERISGYHIDVFNNESCRVGIIIWMNYWVPRVGAKTRGELYNLYRRGPNGYRRWRCAKARRTQT